MPITTAEIAQILADWGESVTHRTVLTAFDPDTQTVTETFSDVPLTALITMAEERPLPGAALHAATELRNFRIVTADLPALPAGAVRRLVHAGHEYEILAADENASAGITRFTGQRRTQARLPPAELRDRGDDAQGGLCPPATIPSALRGGWPELVPCGS